MVNYAKRGRTTATIFQDASIDGLVMPLLELLKGGEVSCYKSIPRFEYFKVRFSAFAKKDMIIYSLLACMDPLLLDLLLACMDPLYSWFLVWIKYLYAWIHLLLCMDPPLLKSFLITCKDPLPVWMHLVRGWRHQWS